MNTIGVPVVYTPMLALPVEPTEQPWQQTATRWRRAGTVAGLLSLFLIPLQPMLFLIALQPIAMISAPWVNATSWWILWFGIGAFQTFFGVASSTMLLHARLEDRTKRQAYCVVGAGLAMVVAIVGLLFTLVFGFAIAFVASIPIAHG